MPTKARGRRAKNISQLAACLNEKKVDVVYALLNLRADIKAVERAMRGPATIRSIRAVEEALGRLGASAEVFAQQAREAGFAWPGPGGM
jgi:transcription antitermination factor NusA-like protein